MGDWFVVDGILIEGVIWVDELMFMGEVFFVEKKVGDKVYVGMLI